MIMPTRRKNETTTTSEQTQNYVNTPTPLIQGINSSSRKYRHINDNALGIIRSTLNSGGFGPEPPNLNNNLGLPANAGPMTTFAASYGRPTIHASGSSAVIAAAAAITDLQQEKGLFSVSQLNVELTEQHVDISGRMEITCLATIPSAVGPGEQFADYKTYSIKCKSNYSLKLYAVQFIEIKFNQPKAAIYYCFEFTRLTDFQQKKRR
uniref:Uncharacterized protein n=1 Tax=Glossina palpalis gambiensis TaxID=67801 RepID=A0A1B0AWN6_9MUSC